MLCLKGAGCGVEFPHQIQAGIAAFEAGPLLFQVDRRDEKHVLAVQREKVGAFPHLAEIGRADLVSVTEFLSVNRRIHEDEPPAALAFGADENKIFAADAHGIGIAEVLFAYPFRKVGRADDGSLPLGKMHAVRRICHALRFQFLVRGFIVLRVHQHQLVFIDDRPARKTAALVRAVGRKRHFAVVKHAVVPRVGVPPVHGAPAAVIRVVLVKDVHGAAEIADAVGIVHPADGRREVITRAVLHIDAPCVR